MVITFENEELYIDDRVIVFAIKMQKELENNSHKGSVFDWCQNQTFEKWLYEFEYHKSKLIAALMAKNYDLKEEFCADLGNYLVALMFKNNVNIQESETLCKNKQTKII